MADNYYVYESIVALGQPTFSDDGTGTDWLVLSGDYGGTLASPAAWIVLSNYKYNVNPPPGDFAFAFNLANTLGAVPIYGGIENAMGGAGSENIFGSDVANILQGDPDDVAGGGDKLAGYDGNDTLYGMGGGDMLWGDAGSDLLFGDTDPFAQGGNVAHGNDTLFGGDGNDTLYGGWGTNALYGGFYTDTVDYSGFFDDFGNTDYRIVADLRVATVNVYARDLYSGDQYLIATDVLGGIDIVRGTGGNDTFYGPTHTPVGEYPVTLEGGAGDDTYIFEEGAYWTIEASAGGYDHVIARASFIMPDFVEELTLTPTTTPASFNLSRGNDQANKITGCDQREAIYAGGGDDVIFGNGGGEIIGGDAGNDTAYGGNDVDSLLGNEGNDLLYGDSGRDWLAGNEGRDRLYGGDQSDALGGREGVDQLFGGNGDDSLAGDQGADRVRGGVGRDHFQFNNTLDILAPGARDVDIIMDFTPGVDKIALGSQLGSVFIGGARFHGVAGEVRYQSSTGLLLGDITGDGSADWAVLLVGAPVVAAGDVIF